MARWASGEIQQLQLHEARSELGRRYSEISCDNESVPFPRMGCFPYSYTMRTVPLSLHPETLVASYAEFHCSVTKPSDVPVEDFFQRLTADSSICNSSARLVAFRETENLPPCNVWMTATPFVGMLAGRKIELCFSWDIGLWEKRLVLNGTGTWTLDWQYERPCIIESLEKLALWFIGILHSDHWTQPRDTGFNEIEPSPGVSSLEASSLRISLFCRLSQCCCLPRKFYGNRLLNPKDTLHIRINVWPMTNGCSYLNLNIPNKLMVCELKWCILENLRLSPDWRVQVFGDLCLLDSYALLDRHTFKYLDCCVSLKATSPLYPQVLSPNSHDITIALHVEGCDIREVTMDLAVTLKDLELYIKDTYNISHDSYLFYLFPPYIKPMWYPSNGWSYVVKYCTPKAVEPFRSYTGIPCLSSQTVSLHRRNFPSHYGRLGCPIDDVYSCKGILLYSKSLRELGIRYVNGEMAKILPVTGPTIPIRFSASGGVTSFLVDINPRWKVASFLMYINALFGYPCSGLICCGIGYGIHKQLHVDQTNQNKCIGDVLDNWAPSWWREDARSLDIHQLATITPLKILEESFQLLK